jgi:hypothetical protein
MPSLLCFVSAVCWEVDLLLLLLLFVRLLWLLPRPCAHWELAQ